MDLELNEPIIGVINGRWKFMGKCYEEMDEEERKEFNRYLNQKR